MSTEPNLVVRRDWLEHAGPCECCGEHLAHARIKAITVEMECGMCNNPFEVSVTFPESVLLGEANSYDGLGCCPSCYECKLIPIQVQ